MAWYDEVFDERYEMFTFHLFSRSRNENDASFIRSSLQIYSGDEVPDLACGHGRHALLLAQEGIRITGVDITERYIEAAQADTGDLPARFLVGDMRTLSFREQFDAAYCYFSSFGFFDDETNFDILQRIAHALKPGGRFLVDLQNRELYSTGDPLYSEHNEFKRDGREYALLLESELDVETSRTHIRQRLFGHPDGPKTMDFSIRLYTMAELRWLLNQAGMEVINTYGDADASEYSMISPRCIVVAQKAI